jgi:hypothetical protein
MIVLTLSVEEVCGPLARRSETSSKPQETKTQISLVLVRDRFSTYFATESEL